MPHFNTEALKETLPAAEPRPALNQAEAIEALLGRLEAAARHDLTAADFFQILLQDVIAALSALSGSVWTESDQGLALLHRVGDPKHSHEGLTAESERQLAGAALAGGELRLSPPDAPFPGTDIVNDSAAVQCLAPCISEGLPGLVLRLSLRPQASLGQRETAGGLLAAVAEIAHTFHLRRRLRQLHQDSAVWKELDDAVGAINAADGLKACSRAMADQVRRLLDADRVSVLVRRGRRCRIAAISSSAAADRRARQVRLLERLARDAIHTDGSYQVQAGGPLGSRRTSGALESYLEETQLRTVRCDILKAPSETEAPVGCLVIDSYTADNVDQWEHRLRLLKPHCARAIERAIAEQSRGWRRLLSPWRSLSRTALWLLAIGLIAGAAVVFSTVPADFTIEAAGRLMPVQRRGVFAPADAIVAEILVSDGSRVAAGQPLVKLIDPELELEHSRLQGELQTAAAKLDAVQARRTLRLRDRETDSSLLSIEEEELKATVAGLQRQLEIVREQQQRLLVASPLAGRVARWDLAEVLQSLPVRHGQLLMDVYDPEGPWRLELDIPDETAGYVRLASGGDEHRPAVEFVFQTDPTHVRSAELSDFADASEIDARGELTVRGLVDLPGGMIHSPQRGAGVIAKIHCGRRAIGFVWFREVIEFVRREILF